MKFSKYNLFIPLNEGNVLVNTFTGATFRVSDDIKAIIEEGLPEKLEEQVYNEYCATGVLIEDNIDEKRILEYLYQKEKFSNQVLNLTILLTYNCNLRCIYCYEGAGEVNKGSLTEETKQGIFQFIKNQIEAKSLKIVSIVLFGGEPLLNFNRNVKWLDEIKEYCDSIGVQFVTSIVTNGILITNEILDKLKDYNCGTVQITLDGIREIHDQRRIYKDGRGSFDEVMRGIKLVHDREDFRNPVIRINIDKDNIQQTYSLLDYLAQEGLCDCTIDFGIVKGGTDACSAYSSHCFVDEEVGDILHELWSYLRQIGFAVNNKPARKNTYCGLYGDSAYTISPKGEIFKCWEHVGEDQHLMGIIDEKGNVDEFKYPFFDWMSHSPFEIEECAECKYMPVCGGGCGSVSYEKYGTYHAKGCFKVKGVLEKQVIEHFKL